MDTIGGIRSSLLPLFGKLQEEVRLVRAPKSGKTRISRHFSHGAEVCAHSLHTFTICRYRVASFFHSSLPSVRLRTEKKADLSRKVPPARARKSSQEKRPRCFRKNVNSARTISASRLSAQRFAPLRLP